MAKSIKSRYAILGILRMIPKSSGYDIKKMIEETTHHFWKESFGSIYPILQELEREGLVLQHPSPTISKRPRNLYSLSAKGEEVLKEWLMRPAELEQLRHELLLKIFFGEFVPPAFNRKQVEEYQRAIQSKRELFLKIREELSQEHTKSTGLPYWLMTIDFGISQAEASLAWCKQTLAQLTKLGGPHVKKK